jgi:P-type conjugative transfer protein TrbG
MQKAKVAVLILGLICCIALPIVQAAPAQTAVRSKSNKTFNYLPNEAYTIHCQEGRITDVQLQQGEELKSIGGGDSTRWIVDKDISGTGAFRQWHVWLKPVMAGIVTNFIINTDRRSYYLEAYATVSRSTMIINWRYPQDERNEILRKQQADKEVISLKSMTLENLNFNYRISGRRYPWKPEMAFDDGCKTYLKMPAAMKTSEAPALFIKNGKELLLVNYRVKKNYYIIDRLFTEAQLRCGIKEKVKIKRRRPEPEREE